MSTHDIMCALDTNEVEISRRMARSLELLGELDRRRGFEDEGATSIDVWATERLGLSTATARARTRAAARLWDLPHLHAALADGELTFDKLAAVMPVATPENDAALRRQARRCTVRQLRDQATAARRPPHGRDDYAGRSLRFHDECHTIAIKLPSETYAECHTILDQLASTIPSDGETPLDQRRCDAFVRLLEGRISPTSAAIGGTPSRASTIDPDDAGPGPLGRRSGYTVVVHTPLSTVLAADGSELERLGLLDRATVQRVACDATIVLALDTDIGHTMYEGRAKRFPTATQRREVIRRDRHCRFPGCTNWTFTNTHHLKRWKDHGRTDLPNLVLLCEFHHHTIHENRWRVSGDANGELTFVGPTGRPMTSRPSPLWTRASRPEPRSPGPQSPDRRSPRP
jgi:hypothetical protein